MKYANLTLPSKKLCFVMALAAGTMSFPLSATAEPAVQATQQSGVLKGQVVDKQGEPVIGATIKVKNVENVGTVTDFDGYFDLKFNSASYSSTSISIVLNLTCTLEPEEGIDL